MTQKKRITNIENKLKTVLKPQQLMVTDESQFHVGHAGAEEGHGHFAVDIVAEAFNDKSLIERHRMVYTALGDLMQTDIHALRITARTPNK